MSDKIVVIISAIVFVGSLFLALNDLTWLWMSLFSGSVWVSWGEKVRKKQGWQIKRTER